MFTNGLTSFTWLSSNLEEFIRKCEIRVNEGDSFLNSVSSKKKFLIFLKLNFYYKNNRINFNLYSRFEIVFELNQNNSLYDIHSYTMT